MDHEPYGGGVLARRLVVIVVLIAGLSLGLFSGLTYLRLQHGTAEQVKAVGKLTRERVVEQMRLQNRLISAEMDRIRAQTAQAVRSLANNTDTAAIIERGNIVAIDLMLKNAVENSHLTGLIALDTQLNAVGSHQPGLVLAKASGAFAQTVDGARAKGLVLANDPQTRQNFTGFTTRTKSQIAALGLTDQGNGLVVSSMFPVFDDFGELITLLVGHRVVDGSVETLQRYTKTEQLGFRVIEDDQVLLNMGLADAHGVREDLATASDIRETRDGVHHYQCAAFRTDWKLCVYQPVERLSELTHALISFIHEEKNSLISWLGLLYVGCLSMATLVVFTSAKRILAPLQQITRAVHSVAKGNWMAAVSGQRRKDEVGDIARAVAVLQNSMKERERLQADVADLEQVRAREGAVEEAVNACQAALRQKMFGLSDISDMIEKSSQKLVASVSLAEGEADEARLVNGRALTLISPQALEAYADEQSPVKLAGDSIDRLGETISQLGENAKSLSSSVASLADEVGRVDRVVKQLMWSISRDRAGGLPAMVSSSRSSDFREKV